VGFLKKLGKGVGKLLKKVVKPAAGFAAKLVGGLNIPLVSGAANLAGKLVKAIPDGSSKSSSKAKKVSNATASALASPRVTDVLGDVSDIANGSNWFKKNWYWVVFPPVLLFGLIMLIFKRK